MLGHATAALELECRTDAPIRHRDSIVYQLGQCSSRLGIMLPSPGEEIGQIDHRTSFGSAAAINSPARATARPGAIGAAKTAPFSA
jgi:hypothetical protein